MVMSDKVSGGRWIRVKLIVRLGGGGNGSWWKATLLLSIGGFETLFGILASLPPALFFLVCP